MISSLAWVLVAVSVRSFMAVILSMISSLAWVLVAVSASAVLAPSSLLFMVSYLVSMAAIITWASWARRLASCASCSLARAILVASSLRASSRLRSSSISSWAMLCWVPGSAELSSSPDMVLAVSWVSRQQLAHELGWSAACTGRTSSHWPPLRPVGARDRAGGVEVLVCGDRSTG